MPYFEFNSEERIDVDDFLKECDDFELEEVAEWMRKHKPTHKLSSPVAGHTPMEEDLAEALNRILHSIRSLSDEQIQAINQIARTV